MVGLDFLWEIYPSPCHLVKGPGGPNGLVSPGPSLSARSGFLFVFVAVLGVVVFVRLIGGLVFYREKPGLCLWLLWLIGGTGLEDECSKLGSQSPILKVH